MTRVACIAGLLWMSGALAEDTHNFAFTQADRLEYHADPEELVWDLEGWYGGDLHKLWWKLEGHAVDGESAEQDVQLLYSRATTPFLDLQVGLRYENEPDDVSLVIGLHGDLPYRIDTDMAVFFTEDGDVLLRGEFERDLYLTQRLALQPRLEIDVAAQDVPERTISSGVTSTSVGLRLRYDVRRRFTPYVGVAWQRLYGDAARTARATGEDDSTTTFLIGASFWF